MPVPETILDAGRRQPATADAAALGAGLDALDTPADSAGPCCAGCWPPGCRR